MSTFLELAQKLRRECINAYAAGPSTVVGQTGLLEEVVNWTADSWRDIQLRYPNWRWMRSSFTVNTTSGDDTYAYGDCTDIKTSVAIARFAQWWAHDKINPFKCYLTSGGVSGQYRLHWMTYEEWRRLYKFSVQQSTPGQPIHVSVDDDENIVLGPTPNGTYTVTGEYQRGPQILAVDADTPDMPVRFHDLIVYYAMQRYAAKKVAPEVLARARLEGGRIERALEQSQVPMIRFGSPMA